LADTETKDTNRKIKVTFPLGESLLSDYVKKHAENMPDKVAINFYGREITYKELDESSDRLSAYLGLESVDICVEPKYKRTGF